MCPINLITVLMDVVLAIVINTSAMLLSGASISFVSWYPGTCAAFATNVVIQLVAPVPLAAQAATSPLGERKGRPVFSVFIENLIYVTLISFTMAVINTGGVGVVEAWLATYGWLVLIGYVTSLVLFAITHTRVVIDYQVRKGLLPEEPRNH